MHRFPVRSVLGVALAVVVFLFLLRIDLGGTRVARAVDDLGEMLAAAIACLAAGRRARRTNSAARSWVLLSIGTGAWAAGQAVWSYYELLANRQTPFPSMADAGFLAFPVFAVAGVLTWPSVALRGAAGWRSLLDGLLVAGSLFIVSWVTALGAAVHGGGSSLDWVVSVSYPVSDLILITLTVILVAHAPRASRAGLGVLAVGLVCLCVGDSGFAYLTSVGRYATGSPVDAGWFGGFLLIAVAANSAWSGDHGPATVTAEVESRARLLLPYLPAGLGLSVAVGGAFAGEGNDVTLGAATGVVAILLARQLVAVLENRQLVTQLKETQHELHHQAFHDPLTGLANRALFADRLRHGLELHRRDLRPLSLLYCDLDGFKVINDSLGHETGDEVLKIAAERLLAVTRTADTIARLGGDEFAILLEHGDPDATAVVTHILDAFNQPTYVGGRTVALGISIGIAELDAAAAPITAAVFLHRADVAMYQAKRAGTGLAMTWLPSIDIDLPAVLPDAVARDGVPARPPMARLPHPA